MTGHGVRGTGRRGRTWAVGNALIAVGLAWLIADRVLVRLYPLSWGGPDIGGGLAVLLAGLTAAAGLVLLLAHAGEGLRVRPARQHWRSTALMGNGALAAGWIAALVLLPQGGNDGVNGRLGLSVTPSGAAVLLLQVCRGSVDTVTVVGPNRGDATNDVLARLTAPAAVTAPATVVLSDPPQGWSIASTLAPPAATSQLLLIASADGRQSTLGQVSFTGADLAALDPSTVQYTADDRDGQTSTSVRVPLALFQGLPCDD